MQRHGSQAGQATPVMGLIIAKMRIAHHEIARQDGRRGAATIVSDLQEPALTGDRRLFLQASDQARRVPTIAAKFLNFLVKTVNEPGHLKCRAVCTSFLQGNSQVLAHPLHSETEIEMVVDHRFPAILHLPGLRGTFGDGANDGGRVEAGTFDEMQCLGQSLDNARNTDLIGHFGELP